MEEQRKELQLRVEEELLHLEEMKEGGNFIGVIELAKEYIGNSFHQGSHLTIEGINTLVDFILCITT